MGTWLCFVKKRMQSIGKTQTWIQAQLPVRNDGGIGSFPISLVCPTDKPANKMTVLLLSKLHKGLLGTICFFMIHAF